MTKKKIFIFIILMLLNSCVNMENKKIIKIYEAEGFLGNTNQIKINNPKIEAVVSLSYPGSSIKITNLLNNVSVQLNNLQKISVDGSRIVYVSESVFQKLKIDKKLPFVRIEDISNAKSNPTFIASKAEIFQEERKVSNTSKVSNVEIAPLSSTESNKTELISKKIYLQFGSFYYSKFANELRNNLINSLKVKNIAIEGVSKNYYVTIGPISNIKVYDSLYYKLKQNNYDGFKILVK